MTGPLPYLQPVLNPGGVKIFEPLVVSARGKAVSCPECGGSTAWLSEGALDFPMVVCPKHLEHSTRDAGRLLHALREIRCKGMVQSEPDWMRYWPECALDLDLVRRINPRRGDALKPSTILGYAGTGVIQNELEKAALLGRRSVWGVEMGPDAGGDRIYLSGASWRHGHE